MTKMYIVLAEKRAHGNIDQNDLREFKNPVLLKLDPNPSSKKRFFEAK